MSDEHSYIRSGFAEIARKLRESSERQEFDKAFSEAQDATVVIAKMTNAQLARWQTDYSPGSPQYLLATHEWQRRLTAMQVRATRFAAWLGIVGVVVGTVLGATLTYLVSKADTANTSIPISKPVNPDLKPELAPPATPQRKASGA